MSLCLQHQVIWLSWPTTIRGCKGTWLYDDASCIRVCTAVSLHKPTVYL